MAFAVTNDYFALADTKWVAQSSANDPTAANAQSMDSFGTVACETVHSNNQTWTVPYAIKSAAEDTNGTIAVDIDAKVVLGQIFAIDTATNASVTAIDVATTNTTNPIVSVTGTQFFGDTTGQATYPATATVLGIKKAQAFGWVVDTGSRTTSGNLALSAQVYNVVSALGVLCQTDVYQGRAEGTGDLTACTGTPNATADTGWTLTNEVSTAEENTAYGTAAVSVFKNLARV